MVLFKSSSNGETMEQAVPKLIRMSPLRHSFRVTTTTSRTLQDPDEDEEEDSGFNDDVSAMSAPPFGQTSSTAKKGNTNLELYIK
jgi:hypothetical protein